MNEKFAGSVSVWDQGLASSMSVDVIDKQIISIALDGVYVSELEEHPIFHTACEFFATIGLFSTVCFFLLLSITKSYICWW